MKNAAQRVAALLVRDSGKIIVTGPVKLVQGGEGLIARFPVTTEAADGKPRFWGIVSAVMSLQALYRDSGLLALSPSIDVAITAVSQDRAVNRLFYGQQDVTTRDPVQMIVRIGHEDWLIAAAPKAGWELPIWDVWRFRLLLLLGEFIIILPMVWAGRLMEERQRNMRALEQQDDQMKLLSHRLQIALETSKIGVWEYDISGNKLIWDERMKDLYGVAPGKPIATYEDWKNGLHPDDFDEAQREFAEAIESQGEYRSEFRVVAYGGGIRHIRAIGTAYKDSKGNRKIVGVNWDVTADVTIREELERAKSLAEARNRELEATKAKIEHNALHDFLTDLPNRRYLDEKLAGRQDAAHGLAILHIDLDRFKQINDTLGHQAGDFMLLHAAGVLRSNICGGEFVARIGGDEFVILVDFDGGTEQLGDLADRIIRREPVHYNGITCRTGASIGIACDPRAEVDARQLLLNADIALYRAKSRGRNRSEFFSVDIQHQVINNKRVSDEILTALEKEEFVPYYQLQFAARDLSIAGAETLVRWPHPTKGLLAPDAFLTIAEDLDVVAAIDAMIFDKAHRDFTEWQRTGIPIPKISVNVSTRRLYDPDLGAKLAHLPIKPGTVSFELLESIFLDDCDETVLANLQTLRRMGIDIEIDDFGTGHASIVSLLKIAPRTLKIDRELVMPITGTDEQRQLVRSIIEIGKSLNIKVVAEGVETWEHIRILQELGCDILQGYALARPMPLAAITPFVREERWRHEG